MDAQVRQSETRSLKTSLNQFFYSKETPYGLALVRIILPLVLLIVIVPRWFFARELYSSDGAAAPLAMTYHIANFPPEPSGIVAVAAMSLLILSLISSSIGWFTRASLLLSFGLYTYINLLDYLTTMTKYSVISSHLLLLLAFSHCGSVWSVDSRRSMTKQRPKFDVWPRRLLQLLIGLIYLGAATTKLHTGAYFTSDQLRFWLMTNLNHHNPAGEILSFYPEIIIVMANVAIVWQLIFVFVVWRPYVRFIILGMGVFFHVSTTPTLGLYIFPCVMISSYLGFLSERDVRLAIITVRSLFRRAKPWRDFRTQKSFRMIAECFRSRRRVNDVSTSSKTAAWAGSCYVWATILLGSAVVGVAAEYSLDPYQQRNVEGPLPLRPADAHFVARLNEPFEMISESDLILSLDAGTTTLGGVLQDLDDFFRRDEPFIVQASLVPPHPDMWLECNLLDATGRTIQRVGQMVPREQLRANWTYQIPVSLPAGIYTLELRTANSVLATKPVHITE
ncbi:MAG: HTTM domain-containing protein [Rhodopirellula sp.]|nr:HTTM domain-containing protein [Rhodopirellula sp.]